MTDTELQQTFDGLRDQLTRLACRRGDDAFVAQVYSDARTLISQLESHFQVLLGHNIRAHSDGDPGIWLSSIPRPGNKETVE
jgi:hypothetical protein